MRGVSGAILGGGLGDYVVVHDPDGHELVFEPADA
jgi:hypothetical protein